MKAVINPAEAKHNASYPKSTHEVIGRLDQHVIYNGEIVTPITAIWSMSKSSKASVVHCSVWIRQRTRDFVSGSGSAGGYGYHKQSAAFQEAINKAGVSLFTDGMKPTCIGGMGGDPVLKASEAILRACLYRGKAGTTYWGIG